jgi:hypothetical protein
MYWHGSDTSIKNDEVELVSPKNGSELMCSRRVSSPCFLIYTRRATHIYIFNSGQGLGSDREKKPST